MQGAGHQHKQRNSKKAKTCQATWRLGSVRDSPEDMEWTITDGDIMVDPERAPQGEIEKSKEHSPLRNIMINKFVSG